MTGRLRAPLLALAIALVACGGNPEKGPDPSPEPRAAAPVRYAPPHPDCRAARAPGTVGSIGEDVIGVPVAAFRRCYGAPAGVERVGGRRCLLYAQRGGGSGWRFCVARGRIVSAEGAFVR